MKTHTISNDDLQEAVDEMKGAVNEVINSAGNLVRSIDWRATAPKIAAGIILLYSIRNKKLSGVVTSLVITGVSRYIINRIATKEE